MIATNEGTIDLTGGSEEHHAAAAAIFNGKIREILITGKAK